MKTPTDKDKLAMVEDYQKSMAHLSQLGLVQLVDGGLAVRATPKGIVYMVKLNTLDKYNKDNPK